MKGIKCILLAIALSMGFILQCEVFQSNLWRFDKADFLASAYHVPEEQMEEFVKEISSETEKNHVKVFSTFISKDSNYEMKLHIYGNEVEIRQILAKEEQIEERTYRSLFNGITSVEFHPFAEMPERNQMNNHMMSYIGEADDIQQMYDALNKKYDILEPMYWEATEEDMILIVWGFIAVLMIVMNCVDVIRRKKEVVIRAAMGESVWKMIAKTVGSDLMLNALIYIVVRWFVFQFMSGEYAWKLAFMIYAAGSLLSGCIYFAFASFDIRKAFANVNEQRNILYLMYGLKVVVTFVTIFTLVTNLSSLQSGIWSGREKKIFTEYKNHSYFTIRDIQKMGYAASNEDMMERDEVYNQVWKKLYENEYFDMKPIVCSNIFEGKRDYIFVSEYAEKMLQELKELLPEKNGKNKFVVFVPEKADREEVNADIIEVLSKYANTELNEKSMEFIEYRGRKEITYLSDRESYGTATAKNPVVIYQNKGMDSIDWVSFQNYAGNEMLYQIAEADLVEYEQKYHISEQGFEMVWTNAYQSYQYRRNFIVRLISFVSSLCVVVFILQLMLTFIITRMEYRLQALELSLKKILGYSMWEKNRKSLIISVGVDIIVTITLSILFSFGKASELQICMGMGIIIAFVELMIVFWNIGTIEKENVHKVLKGGCL